MTVIGLGHTRGRWQVQPGLVVLVSAGRSPAALLACIVLLATVAVMEMVSLGSPAEAETAEAAEEDVSHLVFPAHDLGEMNSSGSS